MTMNLPILLSRKNKRDIGNLENQVDAIRTVLDRVESEKEYGDTGDDSYIDPLVSELLRRIDETSQSILELRKTRDKIISTNDDLRELTYINWSKDRVPMFSLDEDTGEAVITSYGVFDPKDITTFPPVLQAPEAVLMLIDSLNEGVGMALRIVMEMRYPESYRRTQPLQYLDVKQPAPAQEQAPVIVSPTQAVDQARVRSVWTGYWEERLAKRDHTFELEKMRLTAIRENKPVSLTNEIIKDPIDRINELPAVINETKIFYTTCLNNFTVRRNPWYATSVHQKMRSRVTVLMTAIESFVYAQTDLDIKEAYDKLIAQSSYFTRIIEANASQPTTIQNFTRPYREDGFSDEDFEPENLDAGDGRRPLGARG